MYHVALPLLLFLMVTTASADVGKGGIQGHIIDAETGLALASVAVVIDNERTAAFTDERGEFMIADVPEGRHSLLFHHVGYTGILQRHVLVKADSTTILRVRMVTRLIEISGVMVEGLRPLVNMGATTTQARITSFELENLPVRSVEPALMDDPFNTEEYRRIDENSFLDALPDPVSTFSIDVDNASYTNVRRFINSGELPPRDAIRSEEMLNFFTYDYAPPGHGDPLSITTEVATCPWNSDNKLVLVALQARKLDLAHMPPSHLVFLLDISGSMNEPNKLPLLKSAFRMLGMQLRDVDTVSIVVYSTHVRVHLPPTSGARRREILTAIDTLSTEDMTSGYEGLQLAYRVAREHYNPGGNNRILLATDGDFNVGPSSESALTRMIEEHRSGGVFLSIFGLGMGNLKEAKLEAMADRGNGVLYYIDNLQEAQRVLVGQIGGTLYTVARDVKVQVEFNPAKVQSHRLIGYENRLLRREDFENDAVDAGDMGAGHSVTALYEIIPMAGSSTRQDAYHLRYQRQELRPEALASEEMMTVSVRYKPPKDSVSVLMTKSLLDNTGRLMPVSDNFRFAAAVAEFAMLLFDSQYRRNASFEHVVEVAERARGMDPDGYRAEFIRLVKLACELERARDR